MAGFKLGNLFNNIVSRVQNVASNQPPVDLTKYPDLKVFVDELIRDKKVKSTIYKDLQTLEKISPTNMNFLETVLKGGEKMVVNPSPNGYMDNINNLIFYAAEIYKNRKKPYSQLYKIFQDYHKAYIEKARSRKDDLSNDLYDDVYKVEEIPGLKNFVLKFGKNGEKSYKPEDKYFQELLNIKDKNVQKYIDAINSDNVSLPVDLNTGIGILYMFFKTLHVRCKEGTESMANLRSKLNVKGGAKEKFLGEYKEVADIPLGWLSHRHSHVEFHYKLFDMKDVPIEHGSVFDGKFKFYRLTKNLQFINEQDQNVSFSFQLGHVPVEKLEMDKIYLIKYSSSKGDDVFRNTPLKVQFVTLKIAQMTDNREMNIQVCDILDDFIDVYMSYMSARTKKIEDNSRKQSVNP